MELQYDMVTVSGLRTWKNDAVEPTSCRFKIDIGPYSNLEPLQAFKSIPLVALVSFR